MKRSLLFVALVVIGLVACTPANTPTPVPPTIDLKATETQIAANIFATQTANVPTPTNTSTPTIAPSNTPTISATPTRTSSPTRTFTPTRAPTRTNTPRPSTTPRPTVAPTPTRGISDAERHYLKSVQQISYDLADLSFSFGDQMDAIGENSLVFFDNQWRTKTALILAGMKADCKSIRALKPPALFTNIHAEYLDAANHIDSAVDLFASGVDDIDPNKIQQSNEQFNLATEATSRATEKLNKLIDTFK